MWFRIRHRTTYSYERPVGLGPHRLRLTPRAGPGVAVMHHRLEVDPPPRIRWQGLDPDGNVITGLEFSGETHHLSIESHFELSTDPAGAEPRADAGPAGGTLLPEPYGPALRRRLAPWLGHGEPATSVGELAASLERRAEDGLSFLCDLNRHLHRHMEREIRDTGSARPPEETLHLGRGACRDLTMLFVAVCRSRGWAARFVSGYQAHGDPGASRRHMHAWPEVYLPGAGWRGFDPTHGRSVGEGHVALAAAADPADAAPVEGSFLGAAGSRLDTSLSIETQEEPRRPTLETAQPEGRDGGSRGL